MIETELAEMTPTNRRDRFFRKMLLTRFRPLLQGHLVVIDSDGHHLIGEDGCSQNESPAIYVHNPRFYRRILSGGNLAAAEAFMDRDWSCNDLTRLIRLMIQNLQLTDSLDDSWARGRRFLERMGHWLRRNTLKRSRQNIEAHYDLGNRMFSLFLDPTMNYSSALFKKIDSHGPRESLHRAQLNKMEKICRTLALQPGDHLLEIGTGWGSLACYAAKHFGCKVTTTTISKEQYQWVKKRIEIEGLEDQVTLLDQDYRNLTGKFDKIVSVEMIEAVGDQYYGGFFAKCRDLLTSEGILLLQAITIVDQRYQKHLRSVDFICKYIFPGGSLPCVSRLVDVAAKSSEFRLLNLNDFAPHYAETLRRWREKFWQNIEAIKDLGYDDRFIRMWDYYLAYCESGFDERQINVSHLLFGMKVAKFDPAIAESKLTGAGEQNTFVRTGPRPFADPEFDVPFSPAITMYNSGQVATTFQDQPASILHDDRGEQ